MTPAFREGKSSVAFVLESQDLLSCTTTWPKLLGNRDWISCFSLRESLVYFIYVHINIHIYIYTHMTSNNHRFIGITYLEFPVEYILIIRFLVSTSVRDVYAYLGIFGNKHGLRNSPWTWVENKCPGSGVTGLLRSHQRREETIRTKP